MLGSAAQIMSKWSPNESSQTEGVMKARRVRFVLTEAMIVACFAGSAVGQNEAYTYVPAALSGQAEAFCRRWACGRGSRAG
jgi:hypothetical protein